MEEGRERVCMVEERDHIGGVKMALEGEEGGGREILKQEDVSHSFKNGSDCFFLKHCIMKRKSDEINKPITV